MPSFALVGEPSRARSSTVAFSRQRRVNVRWPRAPVEHSAAKQIYVNPPVFSIVRFQRIWGTAAPGRKQSFTYGLRTSGSGGSARDFEHEYGQ